MQIEKYVFVIYINHQANINFSNLILSLTLCLSLYIFQFFYLETSCGLRLWKTVIPPVKIRGENVLLECQYELNNSSTNNQYNNHNHRQHYRKNNYLYYDNNEEEEESLYSVKWYKDNEEFYRFVPKANPPQHSYKFDGIKVDVRYIYILYFVIL